MTGTRTAALLLCGALTVLTMPSATAAGTSVPHFGEQVLEARDTNLRTLIFREAPFALLEPERGVLRLSVPREAELQGVQRDRDGYDLAVEVRTDLGPRELFSYYRQLLAAQGFALASVSEDLGGSIFSGGYDAEHVEAVFVRTEGARALEVRDGVLEDPGVLDGAGDRVEFLLDREDRFEYVVYLNVGAQGEQRGVFERALYQGSYGAPYAFYGPVGVEGLRELPGDERRVRFVAPQNVSAFRIRQRQPGVFEYAFRSNALPREMFEFYDELLREQGFRQLAGSVDDTGGRVLYSRNGRRLSVDVQPGIRGRFTVEVNLSP